MASSTKPVERIDFILRILMATMLAVALERILSLKDIVNPSFPPSRLEVLIHVGGYLLVAIFMLCSVTGRLLDAGLSISYLLPISLLWTFSTVSLMFGTHHWQIGLAILVLLLLTGGFFPSKLSPQAIEVREEGAEQASETPPAEIVEPAPASNTERSDAEVEKRSSQDVEARRIVGIVPSVFLAALIVIACLWLLLIFIENTSGQVGVWIAWIGYLVLGFFWFGFVAGRFKDAGLLSGKLFLYLLLVSGVSLIPLVNHWITGYGALAIFILIQIPIVFLRSKLMLEELVLPRGGQDDCLRDPLEGILVRHTDEAGITYQRPTRNFLKDRGLGVSNWAPKRKRY